MYFEEFVAYSVQRRLKSHITMDWHLSSIRLAGRIFGDFQKPMAALNKCPSKNFYIHF